MAEHYLAQVTGPAVADAQKHYYGQTFALTADPEGRDRLGPEETTFIAQRDSFYLASITETMWPYIQHRGGQPGFLKVIDSTRLAFADFRGNRQMLTTGNVAVNNRVALFLMDYPHRERLKILGHARVLDAREHPDLVAHLAPPELRNVTERIVAIDVVSFDWNCPKFIVPRYTVQEVEGITADLRERIQVLETELKRARSSG